MPAVIIVGAQWGDEGKAKIIDLLAEDADIVVRYQGGCNAGHTVVCNGETFKFHLIPSGVLYPGKQCVIGPGTVISPDVLKQELDGLIQKNISTDSLNISPKAHITFPYHIELDSAKEELLGTEKIGTTKRGIGPTYEDKIGRIGLRVGDLFLPEALLTQRLNQIVEQKNPVLTKAYGLEPIQTEVLMDWCLFYRDLLQPYVRDTDILIADALKSGKNVLLEGAQGTMLDLDHGTYPFVTSSNPTAGGACTGSGIGPRAVSRVIGITKAYTTRVGAGPFPTELFDAAGEHLARIGCEVGTTTGRARRCGWFDAVAMRYAAMINGLDGLAITKLDVFEGLSEIRLCTAYKNRETGETVSTFPNHIETLALMDPVYETYPGWNADGTIQNIRRYEDLPQKAKTILEAISQSVGVPVSIVSLGPDREQTIHVETIMQPTAAPSLASAV